MAKKDLQDTEGMEGHASDSQAHKIMGLKACSNKARPNEVSVGNSFV